MPNIEDFEFKDKLIEENDLGKKYLTKNPFTGAYYEVLVMPKG